MHKHALNRLFTRSLQTFGILCFLILNPGASVSAQANDQNFRSVILKITKQITDEFSKVDDKEKWALDAAAQEKLTAEANVQKMKTDLTAAQDKLAKSEANFKELREKYDALVAKKAEKKELEAAAKEVEKAGKERDKAKETLYYLENDYNSYSDKSTEADAKFREMANAFAMGASDRAVLKAELELASSQWQADSTIENLIALNKRIVDISCKQNILANPLWKTTPNHGAKLYYQSVSDRESNAGINPIKNPTQTQQSICLGIYYVWAVRGGKVTSNKDIAYPVYLGLPDVTVVEDR
jgi:hypothetical protein